MTERLWEDRTSGLVVAEDEFGKGHSLTLTLDGERIGILSKESAKSLAKALSSWLGIGGKAGAGSRSIADVETPAGVTYQVYYIHEVSDADGEPIPCPALGSDLDDGRFTWDEPTVAGVQQRLSWLGEQLADLEKKHAGIGGAPSRPDDYRPWASIFRMPEDVRVWKGYWDEFDAAAVEDLLSEVD